MMACGRSPTRMTCSGSTPAASRASLAAASRRFSASSRASSIIASPTPIHSKLSGGSTTAEHHHARPGAGGAAGREVDGPQAFGRLVDHHHEFRPVAGLVGLALTAHAVPLRRTAMLPRRRPRARPQGRTVSASRTKPRMSLTALMVSRAITRGALGAVGQHRVDMAGIAHQAAHLVGDRRELGHRDVHEGGLEAGELRAAVIAQHLGGRRHRSAPRRSPPDCRPPDAPSGPRSRRAAARRRSSPCGSSGRSCRHRP